jgi:predicted transcriptional regulator
MPTPQESTLQDFHQFIGEQLRSDAAISPEHALALWRDRQETIEAVREGLADVAAGRTKPHEQFRQEFEQRHGIVRE